MKVAATLGTTAAAMAKCSVAMNPAKTQQQMMDFARANAQMDMAGEVMGDALDDIFEANGEDAEAEQLMNAVLEDLGLDDAAAMPIAGHRAPRIAAPRVQHANAEDAEVAAMLAELKG